MSHSYIKSNSRDIDKKRLHKTKSFSLFKLSLCPNPHMFFNEPKTPLYTHNYYTICSINGTRKILIHLAFFNMSVHQLTCYTRYRPIYLASCTGRTTAITRIVCQFALDALTSIQHISLKIILQKWLRHNGYLTSEKKLCATIICWYPLWHAISIEKQQFNHVRCYVTQGQCFD